MKHISYKESQELHVYMYCTAFIILRMTKDGNISLGTRLLLGSVVGATQQLTHEYRAPSALPETVHIYVRVL